MLAELTDDEMEAVEAYRTFARLFPFIEESALQIFDKMMVALADHGFLERRRQDKDGKL